MFGAIAGDVIGSVFEGVPVRRKLPRAFLDITSAFAETHVDSA